MQNERKRMDEWMNGVLPLLSPECVGYMQKCLSIENNNNILVHRKLAHQQGFLASWRVCFLQEGRVLYYMGELSAV